MISREEALAKVRASVAASGFDVDEQHVAERVRGWVVPVHKPGEQRPLIGGPYFVDKESGAVVVVPSAGTAKWLDEYDATGAPPKPSKGWRYLGTPPKTPLRRPIGGLRKPKGGA